MRRYRCNVCKQHYEGYVGLKDHPCLADNCRGVLVDTSVYAISSTSPWLATVNRPAVRPLSETP